MKYILKFIIFLFACIYYYIFRYIVVFITFIVVLLWNFNKSIAIEVVEDWLSEPLYHEEYYGMDKNWKYQNPFDFLIGYKIYL